jgi:hypothetical protein
MVSNIVVHGSAACEDQSNGQHQYCFHLCSPLIVAAIYHPAIKNDSSAMLERILASAATSMATS